MRIVYMQLGIQINLAILGGSDQVYLGIYLGLVKPILAIAEQCIVIILIFLYVVRYPWKLEILSYEISRVL